MLSRELWRPNASILHDKEYTEHLAAAIKQDLRDLQYLQPQDTWDELKTTFTKEL
jgi:hypothetical protein